MWRWAHGSKCLFSTPLDKTDITSSHPIHPRCILGNDGHLDLSHGRVQGRPHLMVRPFLLGVTWWLTIYPKCAPTYKIYNTTRGTLLALKICMKLAIYISQFRDFDAKTSCKDCQHHLVEDHFSSHHDLVSVKIENRIYSRKISITKENTIEDLASNLIVYRSWEWNTGNQKPERASL
jgi:hypothetical protein